MNETNFFPANHDLNDMLCSSLNYSSYSSSSSLLESDMEVTHQELSTSISHPNNRMYHQNNLDVTIAMSQCEFNEISSPTLTSAHPDSAYGDSPAMKCTALTSDPSVPTIREDPCDDNWRFQIFPEDLLITPDSNHIYKPYLVSATLDQVSPRLFQASPTFASLLPSFDAPACSPQSPQQSLQQSLQQNQQSLQQTQQSLQQNQQSFQQNHLQVDQQNHLQIDTHGNSSHSTSCPEEQQNAAPWQLWDENDCDPSSPVTTSFSLFSPTLPFSVFGQSAPLNQENQETKLLPKQENQNIQENRSLNQEKQDNVTNLFIRTTQQQVDKSKNSVDSNLQDSLFSFMPSYPANETQSPLEASNLLTVPEQRSRQNSNIMSPLTFQFSKTLSSLKSPLNSPFADLSPTNFAESSAFSFGFMDSSNQKSNHHQGYFPPIKPVKPTVAKKIRKDKDGKESKCFPCDMCPSTFSRNHDLKRHIRIHLGIRPYKCNTCPKSFTRMDALNRHKNIRGCKGALDPHGIDHDD